MIRRRHLLVVVKFSVWDNMRKTRASVRLSHANSFAAPAAKAWSTCKIFRSVSNTKSKSNISLGIDTYKARGGIITAPTGRATISVPIGTDTQLSSTST